MCGITGWAGASGPSDPATLARMTGTLSHRGPDDDGARVEDGVALGFRRLSIVDLAGGHQPISNEDDTLWLVFNGEIYNHRALRERLIERGHVYKTQSDAEAILHAYEEWGVDCLQELQGMFGFALWDRPRRRLFAARDRLGIKPLHYARLDDGTVVFGSEIKARLAHPGVPREARYLPSPHTLFRGIHKLPPGHRLVVQNGNLSVEPWWDADLETRWTGSYEAAQEQLRELMHVAVTDRLMADVPLGAMLSGGLDSSIIVSLMAERHRPVKTFSVGVSASSGNEHELPFAREVATALETEQHEYVMGARDLPGYITPLIWNMDEPLVEPAAIPVYLISRVARETVTVVLTGEGADELFAGYPKYGHDHLAARYHRLPRALREGVFRRGLDAVPLPLRKLRVAERSLSIEDPAERWASWFAGFAGAEKRAVLHPDLLRRLDDPASARPTAAWVDRSAHRDPLTRMLYADVKTWLADDLLMKMDRMSMATAIEARVPVLVARVRTVAFSIHEGRKWHGGRGKRILRDTFGPKLPPSITQRAKAGFPIPLDHWFRHELRGFLTETLLSEALQRRKILNAKAVRRIVEDHVEGRRDYRRELWTLLNLELWFQIFIDAPQAPLTPPRELALAR